MKSYWHLIIIASGFVLIIAGFVYNVVFAGIPYQDPPPELVARDQPRRRIARLASPYQDPPPELVARYNLHAAIAQTITTTGIITMLAGIVGGIVLRLLRR